MTFFALGDLDGFGSAGVVWDIPGMPRSSNYQFITPRWHVMESVLAILAGLDEARK